VLLETAGRWNEPPPPDVVAELGNLIQAYAFFTDNGRAPQLAGLFTDDATWDGTELGYGVAHGPDAIVATVLQHFDPDHPMIHVPGPPLLVAISESEVRGASWCLATRSGGISTSPTIYFHYDDEFRRDAGVWRFARRTLLLRFRSG
jgi:hypothetical protein